MTSRSPAGTVMVSGVKRMPLAVTSTRVVRPVGATSPDAAVAVCVVGSPDAAGSMATPTVTASTSAVTPAITWFSDQNVRSGGAGSGSPTATARRARADAFAPPSSSGMNATSATSTASEVVTFTQDATGSSHSSRPPLMTTRRRVAPRSNQSRPARTTDGPPPITDGIR